MTIIFIMERGRFARNMSTLVGKAYEYFKGQVIIS